MVWLLSVIFLLMTVFLYCLGGQTMLWTRRYLLPTLQAALTLVLGFYLGIPWYISLVPLLWMASWVLPAGKNWLTDLLMGLEASVPIIVGIGLFHTNWWLLGLIPAICGLFVPDLPATNIKGTPYQIEWRDVLRSGMVGAVWIAVLVLK